MFWHYQRWFFLARMTPDDATGFQVPLRKLRRSAPMEKDMLLPRGEERRGWWRRGTTCDEDISETDRNGWWLDSKFGDMWGLKHGSGSTAFTLLARSIGSLFAKAGNSMAFCHRISWLGIWPGRDGRLKNWRMIHGELTHWHNVKISFLDSYSFIMFCLLRME